MLNLWGEEPSRSRGRGKRRLLLSNDSNQHFEKKTTYFNNIANTIVILLGMIIMGCLRGRNSG